MTRTYTLALLTFVGAAGCGGSKGALAAANVGIGMAASGISRASGGCFAICTGSDICNTRTGFCESNPCSSCSAIQHCDTLGAMPRCVDNPVPTGLSRKALNPNNALTLPQGTPTP